MIFCSKFIKTMTSSALLAGVASSSFVSGYDTKLRRGMFCNEDKDISSRDSKLKDLTKKSDLLKSLDFKTVASIISASSSIGILGGLVKKLYYDKKQIQQSLMIRNLI